MNPNSHNNLIIIANSSIHSKRYVHYMSDYFNKIIYITNQKLNDLPHNVISHSINFKLSNIFACIQIAKIIKNYPNCNYIHIHQANSYALHTMCAIKLLKNKYTIILSTWGSDILLLPKNIIFKLMVIFNLKSANVITCGSLTMLRKIQQLIKKPQKICLINFGVYNYPTSADILLKKNIILSNRIHKSLYNIDKIIIGFKEFLTINQNSDYTLIIAAEGIETNNLLNLVKKYALEDKIKFVGMLDYRQLSIYYTLAKIFISIPSSDSSSLSLQEAMSYGCFPIVSNLAANTEFIIDNINGIIYDTSYKLADVITKAIKITDDLKNYQNIVDINRKITTFKSNYQQNMQEFLKLYNYF